MADAKHPGTNVAKQREKIAGHMIVGAFCVIGASGVALIVGLVVTSVAVVRREPHMGALNTDDIEFIFAHIERFLSSILPLIGAWVGAVIAFYFARDNFDAATENTTRLLGQMGMSHLETFSANQTMISRKEVKVAVTTTDDDKLVGTEILPRFEGRGRIVVLDPSDRGVGVLHESYVTNFLYTAQEKLAKDGAEVTFKDMIGHPDTQRQLRESVIFVKPTTNLAAVREAMQSASRNASLTVRDCFVTANGGSDEAVLGYLTDLDIAKKARLDG